MSFNGLIGFAVSLVIAAVVVFALGDKLHRHPAPFYLVAIAATALYAGALFTGADTSGFRWLTAILQRGYLASLFLGAVMFCGVLDEKSTLRRRLQPIRGELSILSFILIVGHLLTYLPGYLPRLGVLLSSHTNIALSLMVALVLTALFALLAAMSLRVVRHHMNARVWKAIQRLAYLMVALLALHVGLVLGKSAFAGGLTQSTVTFAVYVLVVAAYAILRIRKAAIDRSKRSA